jgi:hypothetical protein
MVGPGYPEIMGGLDLLGNLVVREGERIDLKQIETVACGADDVFGGGEHFDFPAGFGEEEFHEALPEGR